MDRVRGVREGGGILSFGGDGPSTGRLDLEVHGCQEDGAMSRYLPRF